MTLELQRSFAEMFYSAALVELKTRTNDYAPDAVPLLELLAAAVDANITVQQAWYPLFRKHLSPIRRFVQDGHVESQSLTERCKDASNYLMLFAFMDVHESELVLEWFGFWERQRCACPAKLKKSGRSSNGRSVALATDPCEKCLTLQYLRRHYGVLDSKARRLPTTQKARVLSHTARSRIGGINRPDRSRSRSAT